MREIRFRIWSPIEDQMVYSDLKRDEMNLTTAVAYHNTHPEKGHLMQFTGLRDKNGKDVYEGDVVKWTSTFDGASGDTHIDKMEWQEGYACFMLMPWAHEPHAAEMEVIGNVHAHPELLK